MKPQRFSWYDNTRRIIQVLLFLVAVTLMLVLGVLVGFYLPQLKPLENSVTRVEPPGRPLVRRVPSDATNSQIPPLNDHKPQKVSPPQEGAQVKESEALIDMRVLNYELKYKNEDGGAWKQGFEIPRNETRNDVLQVFVVPHSHCDPGWIQTFDAYFQTQTSLIITTVVTALLKDPRRTFIWAEISYFSWWYEEQNAEMQQQVRTLLEKGQLEFVTGGWVQPDEANTELYAMEVQLQEGREWITEHVGAQHVPQYGWAIDPFGYSPTAAYLWKKYNFSAMLIQRVHYEVKKELALRRHLEFFWRQTWDHGPTVPDPFNQQPIQPHDIFTHVMPFYSYDVPHTCGPDPAVCCQFDFARMSGITIRSGSGTTGNIRCPWSFQPKAISAENVAERAKLLLDQYRKKATLYRSNAVLIPVGDDFRYQSTAEAESQYTNYQLLFDYINANVPNVHVEFSTLSKYFGAARQTFQGPVPILKGSFFTYADREQDYWSGYFTSRVFDKALDRQLERILFAAETLGATHAELQAPRRALSLFQHHDGITGTAKDHVVEDYAGRIYLAINMTQEWILERNWEKIQTMLLTLKRDEIRPCWVASQPRSMTMNLCSPNGSAEVVGYNPLPSVQYCGAVAIGGKEWAKVTLPCETTGPKDSSSTTFVFDKATGLMLEPIREEWKVWTVHQGGAYLFFPGTMEDYDIGGVDQHLTIENGGFVVKTKLWTRTIIERNVTIPNGSKTAVVLDFIYETNLEANNQEWFVRFSSHSIHNEGYFYTDLNGFNFDTHRFREDMPIQSQVFPMPTLASIQDQSLRLTVISEHAHGTASLQDGSIDVWLDRRLAQDDNRGLSQGVQDNRLTRTRFRVVLEPREESVLHRVSHLSRLDYNISVLGRQMWDELQHPIELFGKHTNKLPTIERPKSIQFSGRQPDETLRHYRNMNGEPTARNVSKKVYDYDKAEVPFVIMVFKRLDYLKKVIHSILESDFPRHRVPLIISHDGHVPEMMDFVASLKTEFPFLIQIVHPFSCYDHPDSFPGNDTSLNVNYEGDAFGHLRSGVVTCCKHHFTWLLTSIFTKIHELDHIDNFLFSEEDYVVAPTIYVAILNGLNAIEEFENGSSIEYFGLELTETVGNRRPVIRRSDTDAWRSSAFLSGPMTLSRRIFRKIQQHAATYCGVDGFDEYNWDWTIVHMQSVGSIPHTVLIPGAKHPLVEHIGIKDGLHTHRVYNVSTVRALNVSFHGTRVYVEDVKPPPNVNQGFGGWGHPADKNHCMSLFGSPASISSNNEGSLQ
jgi:Glycosyl hydrolases family 38 N-terminal domain/N-acetylglucosaminyltransferase II (MGAT2)/Alpha mannosidase middle domain/Glycosyl hydrolases family 38 C-terminal domain